MNKAAESFIKSLERKSQLSFVTNDKKKAEKVHYYLRNNNIMYESEECGNGAFFDIDVNGLTVAQVDAIDALFDTEEEEDEVP